MVLREKLQLELTARNNTASAFARLNRQLDGLRGKLASVRSALSTAFAVGGVLSFAGALEGAKDAMAELDMIAKRARTYGLSSDFYQMLGVAAEEAGVAQSTLNASLTAFAKRVGEARAGAGPLAASLKKIDASLYEAIRSSSSQEEALRILADRMRMTASASDKAAIAAAAFSRAGVDMVRILEQGSDVFDATMQKAHQMGLVIDRDLLENAERIQNEYGLATRVLNVQFKQILVELAPVITAAAQAVGGFVRAVREMFDDGLLEKDRRLLALIRSEIAATERQITDVGARMQFGEAAAGASRLAALQDRLARLRHEMRQVRSGKTDMLEVRQPAMIAPARGAPSDRKRHPAAARKNVFDSALTSIRERIAALRIERQAIGMSAEAAARLRVQHELLTAARRAGVPLTDEVRQHIDALAASYAREEASLERIMGAQERQRQVEDEMLQRMAERRRQWQQQMESISQTIAGSITTAVESWVSGTARIKDAFRSMAQSLMQTAMRTMLNNAVQSLLGGLFKSVGSVGAGLLPFATGAAVHGGRVMPFAAGGVVRGPLMFPMARGAGLVGEAGPEAILPLARGPDGRLGVRAQGQGAPVQVVMNISTPDAEGFRRNRGRIAAELARAVAEGQRNL